MTFWSPHLIFLFVNHVKSLFPFTSNDLTVTVTGTVTVTAAVSHTVKLTADRWAFSFEVNTKNLTKL